MGQKLASEEFSTFNVLELEGTSVGTSIALRIALQRLAELGHAAEIEKIRKQAISEAIASLSIQIGGADSDQLRMTTSAINAAVRRSREDLRRKSR